MIFFRKKLTLKLFCNENRSKFAIQLEGEKNFDVHIEGEKNFEFISNYDKSFPTIVDELELDSKDAAKLDWNQFPSKWIGWIIDADNKSYKFLKKLDFLDFVDFIEENEYVQMVTEKKRAFKTYPGHHPHVPSGGDHDKIIITNKRIMVIKFHPWTTHSIFTGKGTWRRDLAISFRNIEEISTSQSGLKNNLYNTRDILIKTTINRFKISAVGEEDTFDIVEYIRNHKEIQQ